MKIAAILLATCASFAATSAFAADLYIPVDAPYVPEVGSTMGWTGFYAGANVGYGWGDVDYEPGFFLEDGEYDVDGFVGGVQAGYNYQINSIVLGVEADVSAANISGGAEVETFGPDIAFDRNIDWLGTLRGRVGFAAEAFLVYGTAGVAFAGSDASLALEGEDFGSDSATHVGFVVGAGVEAMVTDTISVKGEYLYHGFSSESYVFDDVFPFSSDTSFNVQTVKVGVNFHF